MPRISGADAIVESLIANDVDTVFGLPGGQLDHLFDAVYRVDGKIKLIHTRHERIYRRSGSGLAQHHGRPVHGMGLQFPRAGHFRPGAHGGNRQWLRTPA